MVLYSTGVEDPVLVNGAVTDIDINKNAKYVCSSSERATANPTVGMDMTTQVQAMTSRAHSYSSSVGTMVKFKIPLAITGGVEWEVSSTMSFSNTNTTTTTSSAGQFRRATVSVTYMDPTRCMSVAFKKKVSKTDYNIGAGACCCYTALRPATPVLTQEATRRLQATSSLNCLPTFPT